MVIATGPDAEPVMPTWPGLATFPGTVIHAGQFRNVAEMAGRDVLVVGPGNSGATCWANWPAATRASCGCRRARA